MPRLRVALAAGLIDLATLSSHAEERALPAATQRIVRLSGEAGLLRNSIEAALDLPTRLVEMTGHESSGERGSFQTQSGPQPLSWFSKSSWKFYGGLILITLAVLALAWAF